MSAYLHSPIEPPRHVSKRPREKPTIIPAPEPKRLKSDCSKCAYNRTIMATAVAQYKTTLLELRETKEKIRLGKIHFHYFL